MPTRAAAAVVSGLRVCALTLAWGGAPAGAADLACQPVWEATIKLAGTPNHQYVASNLGGKTTLVELVDTGTTRYLKVGGRWTVSNVTSQDWLAQEKKTIRSSKENRCKLLRDEPVEKETAAVYAAHSRIGTGFSDAELWVSRQTGLLLKMEVDLGVDGSADKEHVSTRVTYDNVQAPIGPVSPGSR